jgi:3-deoxy-D-manno-octulosonate 8-phosphate phosphatase (KDO 8-P phosphatase)
MKSALEWFSGCLSDPVFVQKLKNIKLIISDIDGCLTDGKVYFSGNTEIIKSFHVYDGLMISTCSKQNLLKIALITGRIDAAAKKRAYSTGICKDMFFEGVLLNKTEIVENLTKSLSLTKQDILFFGDDFIDLSSKDLVSIFASPQNTPFYIKDKADLVLPVNGGDGAFRLLLDLVLYVQDRHPFAQDLINQSLGCAR